MPVPLEDAVGGGSQEDHAGDAEEGEDHAEFELAGDLGDLEEEVGGFDFLGRGAPGHVVAEHVGEEGGRDVEAEAAEEDAEEEGPFEVEEDCGRGRQRGGSDARGLEGDVGKGE